MSTPTITTISSSSDKPRFEIPYRRALNIAFRTCHLGAVSILLGGHFFGVEPAKLYPALGFSVATGVGLIVLESYGSWVWWVQGRGVAVLIKLGLLCLVPVFWSWRVPILLMILVIASVGSHMPSRYRYYSFLHRRVISPRGPGFPGA